MKVRVPKSFLNLPESEKEKINEVLTEEVERQVNHNYAELQKIWLQLACIVLNRNFKFGKKRLTLFLGVWREMYRINSKLQGKAEQSAYIKAELNKIFGEGGYPYEFIDKLEEL